MVSKYLENTRDHLLQQNVDLKEKEVILQNHLKENIRMIQMLEENNDPNYAAFTPREVNGYNKSKIEELKKEQKDIEENLTQLKIDMSDLTCKINEINSVIRVVNSYSSDSTREKDKFKILEIQEKERQRIARDLHDSTVQNLTSLVHKTELCMKLIDLDPIRCRLELSSLSKTLHDVIDDTRQMIYDLRPMSIDDIGFEVTVERYLDKIQNCSTIKFYYKVEGNPYKIDSVTSLTLFRIIQEACSNSIKHSEASRVDILLNYLPESLQLKIVDDGKGFDLSDKPETTREDNSGFGISIMRERIYLLSGKIDVYSEPEKGCHIKISIPINKKGE